MSGFLPSNMKRLTWFWIAALLVSISALSFYTLNSSNNGMDPLTADERAWLRSHPVIRFAPDPDFPPTEYFDADGRYSGITADYLVLIEKKLGIRFEYIRLRNWDQVIDQAKTGRIHVFAAAQTPVRSRFALFTTPYLELPAAIIASEKVREPLTPDKLRGMKVSVVSGYAVQEFLSSRYPDLQLDVVPDVQTGLRKVSFGTSDALVENLATASYYLDRQGISNLRIAGESGFSYRMAFGSRKDWPILNRILEKGLGQITRGEKRAIYRRWIPLEPKTLFASKGFQTALLVAFYAVLLLIAGIIIWNRSLSRQVRARTAELERELCERRRIEEDLRESEEKFRVLADTSPTGICLFQGERIVYVNAAGTRLLGFTEQECLSMNFWDWVHEDSREFVRERGLARQRGEQVPSRYECRHVTKSGAEIWIFVSAGLIEFRGAPAVMVSYVDLSDRKQMEEELRHAYDDLERRVEERTAELAETVAALRESERAYQRLAAELERKQLLLRTLIDSIPDLIFYKDNDNLYLGCNKAFEEFSGRTEPELLGCNDLEVFKKEVAEAFRDNDRMMHFEGMPRRNEEWVDYPDGRRILLDTLKTPYYDQNGKVIGLIGISRDITERKRAEEQLWQKKHELELLNNTLEIRVEEELAKNRVKDHLLILQNRQAALGEALDHIAHQWKQPINAISLLIQDLEITYLRGEITSEYVKQIVGKVLNLADHMAQTISVFRDFYRPEKEKTVFLIRESIDMTLTFIEPSLRFHRIEVDLEAEPGLSAIGYPKEYAQVILNILSNAKEIFEERGVPNPRVSIRAFTRDGKAVVTVTDNAGGIPARIINRIFELYFTTRESSGGTGVGLYMSKNIIEKNMGGDLGVENVANGACFRIELDRAVC